MQWNAGEHTLHLGLYSHPKEFWAAGVRTHVNSKRKIPSTGGSEKIGSHDAASCRTASPKTLPIELFRPPTEKQNRGSAEHKPTDKTETVTYPAAIRLVGLVVCRPPRERKIPGSNPAGGGMFSGSSHTSDFKIGTPVATLPGAWRYRVNTGTGWPGVSILWLGEVERWICNFYLSVAARQIVWADPSLRYTRMLLGC